MADNPPSSGELDLDVSPEYEPATDVPDLPDIWGMRGIAHAFEGVSYVSAFAAALIVFAITCLITANVLTRALAEQSITGTIELVEYSLVWLTFLSAAWILKIDGHVKVDLVVMLLPRAPRWYLWGASNLLGLLVCGCMTYFSFVAVYDAYTRGLLIINQLVLPKWMIMAAIPFGFLMLTLEFVMVMMRGPRESFLSETLFS